MRKTVLLALFIIQVGCINSIKQEDMSAYLETHKLILEKDVNSIKYKVSVVSNEVIIRQILKETSAKNKIDSIKQLYDKFLYLSAEISRFGTEILSSQAGSQQYKNFEFGIGDKAKLTTDNGDTLQLLDYNFPRTYGLTNASRILFVFEMPDLSNSKYIEFSLADFGFHTGDVRFKFQSKKIQKYLNKRILFID